MVRDDVPRVVRAEAAGVEAVRSREVICLFPVVLRAVRAVRADVPGAFRSTRSMTARASREASGLTAVLRTRALREDEVNGVRSDRLPVVLTVANRARPADDSREADRTDADAPRGP